MEAIAWWKNMREGVWGARNNNGRRREGKTPAFKRVEARRQEPLATFIRSGKKTGFRVLRDSG